MGELATPGLHENKYKSTHKGVPLIFKDILENVITDRYQMGPRIIIDFVSCEN